LKFVNVDWRKGTPKKTSPADRGRDIVAQQLIEDVDGSKHLETWQRRAALEDLHVLCKIITHADQPFVTSVTINNNGQNPVEPWNLHANDLIQLEIQDRLRDELGIYYERQENAFENLTDEEMEEERITEEGKAIKLVKLAQTFLVSDGNVAAISNMRRV
jgi:hypothetical protein